MNQGRRTAKKIYGQYAIANDLSTNKAWIGEQHRKVVKMQSGGYKLDFK